MFLSETTNLYSRDEDGPGLSKENIIIIAVCASVAVLVLAFAVFRLIRNCRRSSKTAPLPPPQPLAHQREQQVAFFDPSAPRVTTWYQPQPAAHPIHPTSSRQSLLGKESPGLSPSIPPSAESMQDLEVPPPSSSQHLPLPNSFYPPRRPSSRSSFNSSDASCTAPLSSAHSLSPDATTPSFPTPGRRSRSTTGHARPLSMSSTHTYGTTNSRGTSRVRGVPHAPHNQIQIILPTPLASTNNSRESFPMPRGRCASSSPDRRSVADAWIMVSSETYGLAHRSSESLPETVPKPKTPRRRPASMSASTVPPVLYEGRAIIPPVPRLPEAGSVESASLNDSPRDMQRSGTKGRKLEKRRIRS